MPTAEYLPPEAGWGDETSAIDDQAVVYSQQLSDAPVVPDWGRHLLPGLREAVHHCVSQQGILRVSGGSRSSSIQRPVPQRGDRRAVFTGQLQSRVTGFALNVANVFPIDRSCCFLMR